MELKQRLAEKALGFLEQDQLVAIDGSSTNLQLAKNIPSTLRLTVLTNSYSIAHALSMKEQVNVIDPNCFVNTYFKVLDNFFHRTERAPESGVGRRLGAR